MADKLKTGLPKNTAGALSYVLGPVSGVAFLVLEKNKFVRFHAMQSTVTFVALWVLQRALWYMPMFRGLNSLLSLAGFVLWLVLIYKAWQGEEWEVPILGDWAKKLLNKA